MFPSKSHASLALFVGLNLVFISLVSANSYYQPQPTKYPPPPPPSPPPPSPYYKPSPSPPPPPPALVCPPADDLVVNDQFCDALKPLSDVDAATCYCNVTPGDEDHDQTERVSNDLEDSCNRTLPEGFKCPPFPPVATPPPPQPSVVCPKELTQNSLLDLGILRFLLPRTNPAYCEADLKDFSDNDAATCLCKVVKGEDIPAKTGNVRAALKSCGRDAPVDFHC